jgi:malonyl-CoA/methylmalonyl-CoA synthetase
MWERWLKGDLTVFSGVPTMYQRMMRYYEDEIVAKRGAQEAKRYAEAARSFRLLLCGTSALPFSLQSKWISPLGNENRILESYGGTEFSGVFSVQPRDMNNPDVSCLLHSLLSLGECPCFYPGRDIFEV